MKGWVCREYGINPEKVVRPFWPGGDYEKHDYSHGAVVIDNPPFSILAKIVRFYNEKQVPFFLFAPSLTLLSNCCAGGRTTGIAADCRIIYENGAVVNTSFLTNMEVGTVVRTAPELTELVMNEVERRKREKAKPLPKYSYPDGVLAIKDILILSRYGVPFRLRDEDCVFIRRLDSQREKGKGLFGGGFLLSEKAVAEQKAAEQKAAEQKAAAQKAAVIEWELSEREKRIIAGLGKRAEGR